MNRNAQFTRKNVARRTSTTSRKGRTPRPQLVGAACQSVVERLEGRTMLSTTLIVNYATDVNDSSKHNLRWAINQANTDNANDTITFASGITNINILSSLGALPTIQHAMTINGLNGTTPGVTINGGGANFNGLNATAAVTIEGLVIDNFGGNGIVLAAGSDGSTVQNSYVGIGADGVSVESNGQGIVVNSSHATIHGNVVSANITEGIVISGGSALIVGNYIGTDSTGTQAVINTSNPALEDGIELLNSTGATIGGSDASDRNVISGNKDDGIFVKNSTAALIAGNYIGVDFSGQNALGNQGNGVEVDGNSSHITIGGSDGVSGNVISGSVGNGVVLDGNNNMVAGNLIGTDYTGTQSQDTNVANLGNLGDGVFVGMNAFNNTIGGTSSAAANLISNNNGAGVHIDTFNNGDNTVEGNVIGLSLDQTQILGNTASGITVDQNDPNSITTGEPLISGNIIAGNFGDGIDLNSAALVELNYIGTNAADSDQVENFGNGITILSSGSSITDNIIHYNADDGVAVGSGTGNSIRLNSIYGNDQDGNDSVGIDLYTASIFNKGPTPNDSAGHDGSNNYQNFPVIGSAGNTGSKLIVDGTLHSTPLTTFTIDLYSNDQTNPTGYGEGQTYLDFVTVTTDGSGNATFHASVDLPNTAANFISATATDSDGNTSEFSLSQAVVPITVTTVDTTTTLAADHNPSTFGQSVTFTATVTANSGTAKPGGTVTFMDGLTAIGTGTLNSSGIATFTTNALNAGGHSITAVYGGDSTDNGSTSAALTQNVTKAGTSTALVVSPTSSFFGQSVTLTATVSSAVDPAVGSPTGTITFKDGSTVLQVVSLSGNTATFTTTAFAVGGHTITAIYSGDGNFQGSSGTGHEQVQGTTSTAIASSQNPSSVGQSVTFTATVTSAGGTPTGSVIFYDGASAISPSVALVNGVASFSKSDLAAGAHDLTAVYSGDGNYTASTSAHLAQQVNKVATTTTVNSSANPSVFTQSVTFTATVTSSATGSVTFNVDGQLTTVPLSGNTASLTMSALSVGNHNVTATYGGDATFAGSSAALAQAVTAASTSAVVTSSHNPSVLGESITFTANVSVLLPGSGAASGNVTFLDGATPLATVALDSSGNASITTSSLVLGSHAITVQFHDASGDFADSSGSVTQTVAQDATTMSVSSSPNPSVFGQAVTFTASVGLSGPGAGTPGGTVTFMEGSTTLGSGTLNAHGVAMFTTSSLSVASHPITAVYGGDTNDQGTTASTTQVVNAADSSTSLSSNLNPSVFGQTVSFTATVTANAPGAGTPTGSIVFMDGSTTLATVALDASGSASFTTAALSAVDHSITASYAATTNFNASGAALTQTVAQAQSTTTVASSLNPSLFGQTVTFTATVTGAVSSSDTVSFMDGATVLAMNVPVSGNSATFTTSALSVGTHSITAVYSGNSNVAGSTSGVLTQTVNTISTTTTVSSSLNPSMFGNAVTFTANVSAAFGAASGTVTFSEGSTVVAANVALVSGSASFTTSALADGVHTITATFNPATGYAASSGSVDQTVSAAATSTTLSSSLNPSNLGDSVTFTATVSSPNGSSTGSIAFMDGTTLLSTVPLSGGGASFTTSALATGHHNITAVYSGDADFNASTSASVDQLVNKLSSTTSIVSSQNPSTLGQTVTFTATVAGAGVGGSPTGTITFTVDGVAMTPIALDANSSASLSSSTLAVGSHSVSAAYNGNNNFVASSQSLTQNVNQAATSTTLASSANPSVFGQSVTFTATVAGLDVGGSPSGMVMFTIDGTTTPVAMVGGVATLTTSGLSVGTHNVSASYGGDSNFAASSATPISQIVNQDSTTTTVSSSVNPSVFGQSVTFTTNVAVVNPGAGTPSGTVTFMDGATSLGTATLNSSGAATFTTSALSVGSHNITAVYGGDANDAGSTSATLNQNVAKANAAVTVTSSMTPSVFGQSVTFTASVAAVAPGAGAVTGTVTFMDGSTTLGTATLSGGVATLTTAALSVGSHTITVSYSGDSDFNSATANVSQAVNSDSTTTTLISSLNPSAFGQSVTFTATVAVTTPGAGVAGGTVTFMDGSITLATIAVNSAGSASYTTNLLSVGTHPITANYSGDGNDQFSASTTLNQVVNKDATSTAVSSSVNPSVWGQSVTFTASVTGGASTATGSVTFMDGTTLLGTAALDVNGVAAFSSTSLSVAGHTITAVYGGDTNNNASTSAPLTQTVNQAATSTSLTSSVNPALIGQTVTFTASVSAVAPGAGIATGIVTFKDGLTTIGTGTLNTSGIATFSTSSLSVGSHAITAIYSSDSNFSASTSPTVNQVVNQIATSTTLASSVNPSAFGQAVTFTATISNTAATGSVTFTIDGNTAVATVSSGVATYTTSTLSVGAHSVSAVYSGDGTFSAGPAASLTQNVNIDATATSISSSANPSVFGQSITFTATVAVTAPGAGVATGTVTFMDGATMLGTGALSGGIATFSTSALSVGSHTITAVYGGDANDSGSTSAMLSQTVNKAATGLTLASSVNPALFGQQITFTANVGVVAPGAGSLTGTVTFMDGSTNLGTVTLSGGAASISAPGLAVGAHTITATYSGDTHFAGASNTLAQSVNNDSTTTTLSSSLNPCAFGQSVTFTANVAVTAPGAGIATGTVKFMDGSITLATVAVNSAGSASYTTNLLSVGTHPITASYSGDNNDQFSGSSTLNQVVNKDATTTAVTSSVNPSVWGQSVTFTASVTGGTNIAGETVTFLDGATAIGTAALNSTGVATFSTSSLVVASHNITASFGGDANNAASTSATLVQMVNQANTTTTVTSSLNPAAAGQAVTFTASVAVVAPGAGVTTGTVTFKDGTTVLGTGTLSSSGVATFSTSSLSAASHTITAVYGGSSNFNSSSGSMTQTITAAAATISGIVFADQTGNGLSADDKSLAGVTVTLYKDVNGNGVLDSGDTQVGAAQVTGASGVYSFTGLAAGQYLVDQTTPAGYVRTAPALSDYYVVPVAAGATASNLNFDDYQMECVLSNFYNISYVIDGTTTVTDLSGNTQAGDEVTVYFSAKANTSDELSLVSYTAPDSFYNASDANQQVVYNQVTQVVNTGCSPQTFNMTVQIPLSNYQIDFVCGPVIDHLGPNGSNIFYHQQNRFFDSDNGGNGVVATNSGSSVSGMVFCDENLNGVLDSADDVPGSATVSLKNSSGAIVSTTTSSANGAYSFTGVAPGTYTLYVSTPSSGHLLGPINGGTKTITVAAGANSTLNNFAEVQPGNFSGFAWADENNDGKIDYNEAGIINVTITLTGTDCFGHAVSTSTVTDGDGQYIFGNINPGTYKLTESQPTSTDFTEGRSVVGSLGGTASTCDTITGIALGGCGDNAINYNFSELGKAIAHGATATIGFWHNSNGQALLKSLNGNAGSTALGDWLASNFNMYSAFANKSNTYIANFYNNNDFAASGVKLDAQVLAAAFACYVTNSTWAGGTYATAYGFTVNADGSGYESVNVGTNGAAFGVANNANITVLQALQATDAATSGTTLYNGNTTLRNEANTIYSLINQGGDIS